MKNKMGTKKLTIQGFPPNSAAMREYKKSLVFNKEQEELLIGTLLGDASIGAQGESRQRFNVKFEQKAGSKEYIDHLFSVMENCVGTGPSFRAIRGGGARDRASYWFRTYGLPMIAKYEAYFYSIGEDGKRRKKVPENLGDLLTPRVLAYWAMDDGSCTRGDFRLHTQGFSRDEQDFLVKVLKESLGLTFTIRRDVQKVRSKVYYRLHLAAKDRKKFVEMVFPFFVGCMLYKLPQPT